MMYSRSAVPVLGESSRGSPESNRSSRVSSSDGSKDESDRCESIEGFSSRLPFQPNLRRFQIVAL